MEQGRSRREKEEEEKEGEEEEERIHLVAFEADVVGVALHGESFGVLVETRSGRRDGLRLVQSFVLEPHQSLALHVGVQLADRREEVVEVVVMHLHLRSAFGRSGLAVLKPWATANRWFRNMDAVSAEISYEFRFTKTNI